MTKGLRSSLANVLILKYQALFQIGLEPLHLECQKKQNNYSQHLSAQKKEDQVRHVQNIKILAIALKVKMHSKSLQMGPSEETALGTYRTIDKNDCQDLLLWFSTTNQGDLIRLYLFSTVSTTTIGMNMTLYGAFLKMYVIQQIPSLDVIKTRVGQQRMEDFGPHGLVTDCHQLKLVIWLRSLFSL